ncbi:hypothetical protein CQA38_04040 [Campylobacter sp. MIT 12-5580]|nr:hypothetical protein CQA38_04040 [Campylobacter sp. MIT 12-5580]
MDKASFKIPSQTLLITKRSTLNIPNNIPLTKKCIQAINSSMLSLRLKSLLSFLSRKIFSLKKSFGK